VDIGGQWLLEDAIRPHRTGQGLLRKEQQRGQVRKVLVPVPQPRGVLQHVEDQAYRQLVSDSSETEHTLSDVLQAIGIVQMHGSSRVGCVGAAMQHQIHSPRLPSARRVRTVRQHHQRQAGGL
jgi:hypothetical protein